jgi:hypothetical protein
MFEDSRIGNTALLDVVGSTELGQQVLLEILEGFVVVFEGRSW